MEDYLSKLNDQQREAVEYCNGPQLVIAGAGSGKTRVLTYKVVHLLAHGYEPWRIMALTFTNKAAREMRDRITAVVGAKIAFKIWMGTFHSIFLRILRQNAERIGFKSNFTIYDTPDSKSLMKTIVKDMGLDDKIYKVSTLMNAISTAKNALIGPAAYAADKDIREADRRSRRDRLWEVYAAYMNRCHVAGAMDFDDILYYTNILFRDNPDVLNHYKEFIKYVLVDEYQDTNFAQHMIVSRLCEDSHNLCVVGDDAQSIYSFRGANIRNILNLRNAYPELKTHKLEQNYRSTQNIINAANTLIDKNRMQIRKQVFSKNEIGDLIEVVRSYSDFEEAHLVSNRILQIQMKNSDTFEEYAVLYRTNAQSRVLEEALRKRNIPYRIYGGVSFYQRKEVKDAIAYFRLSINPTDDEALKRIINYPARGIGDTTLRKLTLAALTANVSIWEVLNDPDKYSVDLNKGTRNKLDDFVALIQGFIRLNANGADALAVARAIYTKSRILSVLITDTTPESISKQENLEELLNGIGEFVETKNESGQDNETGMESFLNEVSLATDQDEKGNDEMPRVTLMTIHAAKGLEFSNVFIVGVEEDLLPSALSNDSFEEVEEERRLLYVAITRAKNFCMMSYAASRFRNGMTVMTRPSRFIGDIDPKYLNFILGSEISKPSNDPTAKYRSSFHSNFKPTPLTSTKAERVAFLTSSSSPAATNGDFRIYDVSEVSEGMLIEHSRFGLGRIVDIDTTNPDPRIKVKFDNVELKTLMMKFAKFRIIEK